jgi:hypothetical protein
MKRIFFPASALVLVLVACGAAHASAPRLAHVAARQHTIAPHTKTAAIRKAAQLLDEYVPPHGAVRLQRAPTGYHQPSDPGAGIFGKRVDRHRYWRVQASVQSIESSLQDRRLPGWGSGGTVSTGGTHGLLNTDATFAVPGFGGRSTGRLLSVYAVNAARGGGSLLRVDVVVVWKLPRSAREDLPAGVSEIDIHGPRAEAQITDTMQLRTIARWFDRLPLEEPRFIDPVGCPMLLDRSSFTFAFRGVHGGVLARARVPEISGICSAALYSIRGHGETPLLGGDIVYRVQQLIGASWIGPPDTLGLASERKGEATHGAAVLLHDFKPPPGSRRIRAPKGYGGVLRNSGPSGYGETVDLTRFYETDSALRPVVTDVKAHGPRGFTLNQSGVSPRPPWNQTLSFSSPAGHARPSNRWLNVTVDQLPKRTIVRVDAEALWIYPRSRTQMLPAGVRTIDVRAPKVSLQVTNPDEVGRIVRWFDELEVQQPGAGIPLCPLVAGPSVRMVFRSVGGVPLARAFLPATPASICSEDEFWIRGKLQTPLVDRTFGRSAFIYRVERLLGVRLGKGKQ